MNENAVLELDNNGNISVVTTTSIVIVVIVIVGSVMGRVVVIAVIRFAIVIRIVSQILAFLSFNSKGLLR